MNSVHEVAGSTAEIADFALSVVEIADFGEVVDDVVDLVADIVDSIAETGDMVADIVDLVVEIDAANADIVALVAGIAEGLAFVEAADIACGAVEGCWVDEKFVLVVAEIFATCAFVCKGFFYLGTAAADCNLGQTLELEN